MYKRLIQFGIAGLLALPGIAAAAGAVQLPATNQTTCFDVNGNTRPCAGTGEDGETKAGVAWPVPRFTDKGDGTMKDKLTNLVWSQRANSPDINTVPPFVCVNAENDMTWLQSLDFIACLNTNNYLGFKNWRLPNLNELESMVNAGIADTSAFLNGNGFVQVRPSQYWTSTSDASDLALPSAASAWDMDLLKGDFPFSIGKNDPNLTRAVWPVRDASTAPAQIWRTGQTVCFDEVGDARPCTATGEDGEMLAGAAWPVPRFNTNAGATFALDRVTGLVWTTATLSPGPAANPPGCNTGTILNWQEALDHVACLNTNAYLGRNDWRLPNRKELRSLADYSRGAPAFPAGHPFNDLDGLQYWSATTNASATKDAWVVSMFDGSLSSAVKTATLPVWPVSGPDLIPPALTITQGNMTTNVANQAISGTVEAGATVTVAVNNGTPAAAAVTGTTWSFTTTPLTVGANSIAVTAADFSGNLSTASITVTIDTAAPALAMTVPAKTNKKNHTIMGTMEAGATVTVKMGASTLPVTVNGTTWSCAVTELAAGANSITVTATDAAGNVATQTTAITFAAPDGMVSGGSAVSINDALKALRMAIGIITPSADDLLRGDVAPLGAPDDKIDVSDVILILKKAVGIPSF